MKGFTLTEILLASFIMTLIVSGTLAIYLMGQDNWLEGNIRDELQRKASLAMETIVAGYPQPGEISKGCGIREAKEVVIVSPEEIQLTIDKQFIPTPGDPSDDQVISYYLDVGGNLMWDPDITVSDDERMLVRAQDGLQVGLAFTQTGNLVEVDLSLQQPFKTKTVSVSLFTRVRPRNL